MVVGADHAPLNMPRWDRLRPRSRYSWDEPPAHPIEAMMRIQSLHLTGAAILALRGMKASQAAPAGELVR